MGRTEAPKKKSGRRRKRTIQILVLLVVLGIGARALLSMQTYRYYEVQDSTAQETVGAGNYVSFGNQFVRYTGNGIYAFNSSLKEVWSYTYEMENPVSDICGETMAIADLEGNHVCIFGSKGFLGSITVKLPVYALSVSQNGIVAVVMKDDTQTMFELYGPDGTELVEAKTSLTDMGYPLSIDLSGDGKRLLVSYLKPGAEVSSEIVCYDFSDAGASASEKKVMDLVYEGTMIPDVRFMGDSSAAAVGTDRIIFFRGKQHMEEERQVKEEGQIRSLTAEGGNIGIVRENTSGEGLYRFTLYGTGGHVRKEWTFDENYRRILMSDEQVILQNENRCIISKVNGHTVFDGELDSAADYVFPLPGFCNYLIVGPEGIETIRLTKEPPEAVDEEPAE